MDRRHFVLAGAGAAGLPGLIGSAQAATPVPRQTPTVFDFGAAGDGRTDDSAAFARALESAASRGHMVIVPGFHYAIERPIQWTSRDNVASAWGLHSEGARLVSRLSRGEDVLTLTSRHTVRYFRITGGLTIGGNDGRDGNGLRLLAAGGQVYLYNALIDGLSVEHVGGHGLLFEGNVFESTILNSYFQDCRKNGATFAHSKGGICSAINVIGCFFNQNHKCGLAAANFDGEYGGTTDVRVYGGYCRDNKSYGFYYNNGIGSGAVEQVGFENNCAALQPGDAKGAHVYALTGMHLRHCTGYNQYGGATYLLRGYFNRLTVLEGCEQGAGAAMQATGKSRLVQVNGSADGHVLVERSAGGIDVVPGAACSWSAVNSSGPSPKGALNIRGTLASA